MDRSSASAYVYAKASGMLAKSFIGPRSAKLFEVKSLSELWSLLFKTEVPLIPETLLAKEIEEKAQKTFISDYTHLVDCYAKPYLVLVSLLRSYEYNNMKDIASALCEGQETIPNIVDIGHFSRLNYKQWPKIDKITKETPFEWLNTVPTRENQHEQDRILDAQYIKELWDAVNKLPLIERKSVENFIAEDIVMRNLIWAIRLKVYYNMKPEEIIPRLVSEGDEATKNDRLSGPAFKILEKDVDSWADWSDWKYADLLNPHTEGDVWQIDPRWVQQAVNIRLNKMALQQFHQNPFTAHVLVTWFKIKEHELNLIRTAAEGLRMNVSESQLKEFAGIDK